MHNVSITNVSFKKGIFSVVAKCGLNFLNFVFYKVALRHKFFSFAPERTNHNPRNININKNYIRWYSIKKTHCIILQSLYKTSDQSDYLNTTPSFTCTSLYLKFPQPHKRLQSQNKHPRPTNHMYTYEPSTQKLIQTLLSGSFVFLPPKEGRGLRVTSLSLRHMACFFRDNIMEL